MSFAGFPRLPESSSANSMSLSAAAYIVCQQARGVEHLADRKHHVVGQGDCHPGGPG